MKTLNKTISFIKQFKLNIILQFLFILIINSSLFAQSHGKITGLVVDAELDKPLIGANVLIEGTMQGAATDIDGKFIISSVVAGKYKLIVSMIGYTKQVIKDVVVKDDETIEMNVVLRTESIETDEVVITAKAVMNTEASLLAKRQKSIVVSDAVSAEQFQKTGGSNAAEAAKQIVGASIVNGKDVYIRGLGDRYTSTNLNGVQIPSADPYKRSGSIDIIPSNLIDNIQAVKSFTPDKPGDFSGGAVDVQTKDFPDQFNLYISTAAKYNSELSFNNNGLSYNGGLTDWLGYDDGTRALPSIIGSDPWVADIGSAQRNVAEAQRIDDVTKSFNSQMTPFKMAAPMDQSYAFSMGNQFHLAGMQLGLIGSLTYKNQHSGYIQGQLNRWDRGVADRNKTQLDTNFAMSDTRSVAEVVLGGLFKASLKLNHANTVSFNYLYNQNGESTSRFVTGKYPYDIDPTWNYQARTMLYKQRNLQSFQFVGNHSISFVNGLKIDWLASSMNSNQTEPDNRFFYNYVTNKNVYGVKTNLPPERYFRDTEENQNKFNLNATLPFQVWGKRVLKIKLGASYANTDRVFTERRFTYQPVTSVGTFLRNENGDAAALFSYEYLGWTSQDTLSNGMVLNRFSLYINETDQTSSNYNGTSNISAYYGMINLPITQSLRIITGARIERTNMRVISESNKIEDAEIITNDILPSLSFIYNPSSNMNLRLSYGRTLARPAFREISAFQNYEFNGGDTYVGNPGLERTLIDNLDLRWEWFTNPGEVLSVSLFAKRFTNPIESKIVDAPNKVISWTNVDKAEVYGIEFETRKRLDLISTPINNFQLGGNLSLIYSKVDIDPDELKNIRVYEPDALSTRQFQGQSPYIINLFLDYDNHNLGLTVSLYYNVYGKRLASVGSIGAPDVFETPTQLMNFTATKILITNLMLRLKIENLLNSKVERIQEFKGNNYIYSSYMRGRRLTVGLSYNI
ncbi:TonB-dependent receptor [hydrothermal vent metagenome]|uniref:TonB-dependent receptor n=1 Tax=hydrothermal vent metagenome TaxID=652676 RepID=A0A3B1D0G1_9ZZZZ